MPGQNKFCPPFRRPSTPPTSWNNITGSPGSPAPESIFSSCQPTGLSATVKPSRSPVRPALFSHPHSSETEGAVTAHDPVDRPSTVTHRLLWTLKPETAYQRVADAVLHHTPSKGLQQPACCSFPERTAWIRGHGPPPRITAPRIQTHISSLPRCASTIAVGC